MIVWDRPVSFFNKLAPFKHMDTKFTKIFPESNIPKWNNFFRAGDAWLESLQVLDDNKKQIGWGVFYVKPWIVFFCLELFIKAVVSHEDNSFSGVKYRHKITKIIENYASRISLLDKIFNNEKLMKLLEEYERTVDTKFGETYVSIDGNDQNRIIDKIYEIRSEMCRRIGLY